MIYIKINGSLLPDGVKVKAGSTNINKGNPGEASVLSFELIDMNNASPPYNWSILIGKYIQLYEDGVLIFGGQLDEPTTRKINNTVYGMKITCIGNEYFANRRLVNQSFPKQLVSSIIKEIIDTYLATDGIYYSLIDSSFMTSTGLTASINCSYVPATTIFDELCEQIGYQWDILPDKKFVLNNRTVYGGRLEEYVTSYLFDSLSLSKSRDDYRNRQIFRDVNMLTDELVEKATPTPDNDRVFFLKYPVNSKPTLYVTNDLNDILNPPNSKMIPGSQVGISGIDSGLSYYWSKATNTISADELEPLIATGYFLLVKYVGQFKNNIIEDDLVQIAARQAIEGGSGLYEAIEDGSNIEGATIAEDRAKAILRKYSNMSQVINFSSYDLSFEIGDIIDVVLPSFNINSLYSGGNGYLVCEKRISDVGTRLLNAYTIIDGEAQGGWQKFFKSWLSTSKNFTLREDSEVYVTKQVSEGYSWDGSTTISVSDALFPADNLYPANNLYPNSVPTTVDIETD